MEVSRNGHPEGEKTVEFSRVQHNERLSAKE